jgi:hypothetical protein
VNNKAVSECLFSTFLSPTLVNFRIWCYCLVRLNSLLDTSYRVWFTQFKVDRTKVLCSHTGLKPFQLPLLCLNNFLLYEVVSKIFRTGAAIYTAAVVAQKFVPTGQNVNSWLSCKVLRRQRENVRRRRQLWQKQTWLIYHDNAPSHTFVLTQQFLAK